MSTERIDIIIREDGSRVVTRNIQDMGNAAGAAEPKVDGLSGSVKDLNQALAVDKLVNYSAATAKVSSASALSQETAEQATLRIKAMVAASLENTKALNAQAAALNAVSDSARTASNAANTPKAIKEDTLAKSFAEQQAELAALDSALNAHNKSLVEIAGTREFVTDLEKRGILTSQEAEEHLKTLTQQEKVAQKALADQGTELDKLINKYASASAGIQKTIQDEAKLTEAFRVGKVSQEQYIEGISKLNANRAKWQDEINNANRLKEGLKGISLTSSYALREYSSMANGLAQGNIGQVAREAGTLAVRTGLLATILSPLGLAIGGVTLALGAYAAAAILAAKDNEDLQNSLIFTGNAAGQTADQLQGMAGNISKVVGTQHEASQALAQFAANGHTSAQSLQEFAEVAVRLNHTVGTAVSDTVKQFNELGKSPLEASVKLNEQYHFLTASVYEQIAALTRQGDTIAAGEVAQKAFADAQRQRAAQSVANLHGVSLAWAGLKYSIDAAIDSVEKFGTPKSAQQQIDALQKVRGDRQLGQDYSTQLPGLEAIQRANDKREASLREQVELQKVQAQLAADQALSVERQILADQRLNNVLAARLARDVQVQSARLNSQQANVKDKLNADLAAQSAYQAATDAQHAAGLLSDDKYYASRRANIEATTNARIKALIAENAIFAKEDALQQGAAKAQINQLEGPDNQAARIKLQADADAKTIASQQKIHDNEAAMFNLRQQSAAQIKVLTIEQNEASRVVNQYNVNLEHQRELLGLDADQREVEIEIITREQELRQHGIFLSNEEEQALRDTLTATQDYSKVVAIQDQLFENSVGKKKAFLDSILAIKNELAKGNGFTSDDAKQATVNLVGDDVLRNTKIAAQANVAIYKNMYAQIEALEQAGLISARDAATARGNINRIELEARLSTTQQLLGQLSSLQNSHSRRAFEIGKAAAIANATLSAGTAIANAYATQPWYLGLAQGAVAAAILYGQIEQIKNTQFQGYMTGGYTGDGAVDQVAGVVHGKEYVLNAATTARAGVANLEALQRGSASITASNAVNSSQRAPTNLSVNIQNYGTSKDFEVQQISPEEIRIIARDESSKQIQKQTPGLIAAEIANPNSKVSGSLKANTQTQRRR